MSNQPKKSHVVLLCWPMWMRADENQAKCRKLYGYWLLQVAIKTGKIKADLIRVSLFCTSGLLASEKTLWLEIRNPSG